MQLPEKIRALDVLINLNSEGLLRKESQYTFTYKVDDLGAPAAGVYMPRTTISYQDNALFPVMDQHLPEGFLLQRILEMYPKQPLSQLHLLALAGTNGIGRLGYALEGMKKTQGAGVDRKDILRAGAKEDMFDQLVHAYLSTGLGIAGMQPKIMVPELNATRATIPVPNLIVKAEAAAYPGLSANEFMCLSAAKLAGIDVSPFDLSEDGKLLVLDRFDLTDDGSRLAFEDIAALKGLQVRDQLSNRKYHGSYESIVELLKLLNIGAQDISRFFSQLAFSVMVRNGDAHLKNFGLLYSSDRDMRLSPMFDVVTTSIYKYQKHPGGPELEDNTMALKLRRGNKSKGYPTTDELCDFGSQVCGVSNPESILEKIADSMSQALGHAKQDDRISSELIEKMSSSWDYGMLFGAEASKRKVGHAQSMRPRRG